MILEDMRKNTKIFSQCSQCLGREYLWQGPAAGRVQGLGPKPDKLFFVGTDGGAAVFFRFESDGNTHPWDTITAFQQENFLLIYRSPSCVLPTRVVADYKHGRMRVLESNFHDYLQGTVGCGDMQSLSLLQ
jgi:hypothetical protein